MINDLSQEIFLTLIGHYSSLVEMDDDSCLFIHEKSKNHDPETCSDSDQEKVLGCAHNANRRLLSAIFDMQSCQVLSQDEAIQMRQTLHNTNMPLIRLDLRANNEYDNETVLSSALVTEHEDIIAIRKKVLLRLVQLIEEECLTFS